VLGSKPQLKLILQKDWPFAHEAPSYVPSQDAVYFTSSPPLTNKGLGPDENITIGKASRKSDGTWTCEDVPTDVVMGNGSINYQGGVLFCAQGNKNVPGGIVLMSTEPPYKTQTLVDGYHGRLFNSVNDVVTHTDGSIWFTDPIYGFEQGFRNEPQLPCQVYRFEPETGDIRVVADQFGRPNGLCFSPDEKTMYITDTDWIHGDGNVGPMRPGTM
jgi:gluconolactonase